MLRCLVVSGVILAVAGMRSLHVPISIVVAGVKDDAAALAPGTASDDPGLPRGQVP